MKFQVIALIVCVVALLIIASTPFSSSDVQAGSLCLSVDEMQGLIGMDCGGGSSTGAGQTCDRDAEGECWCLAIPIPKIPFLSITIDQCSHLYGACGKEDETACTGGCTGNCKVDADDCSGKRTYKTCEAGWGCLVGMCSKTDHDPVSCTGTKKKAGSAC